MSAECYYVHDGETPLLVIGAARASLLDPAAELWLYASHHLRFIHIPALRERFAEWRAEHPGRLYARAREQTSEKLFRFFGFRHTETLPDGVKIYEVD
jgi:hypothetical protein